MTDEILIPFPPKDYPCRDGREIKTWMDGYEAALNDLRETKGNKISLSPVLADSCQHSWQYSHTNNVNDFYVCTKCRNTKVGNFR